MSTPKLPGFLPCKSNDKRVVSFECSFKVSVLLDKQPQLVCIESTVTVVSDEFTNGISTLHVSFASIVSVGVVFTWPILSKVDTSTFENKTFLEILVEEFSAALIPGKGMGQPTEMKNAIDTKIKWWSLCVDVNPERIIFSLDLPMGGSYQPVGASNVRNEDLERKFSFLFFGTFLEWAIKRTSLALGSQLFSCFHSRSSPTGCFPSAGFARQKGSLHLIGRCG